MNLVVLRGALSRPPDVRDLRSGDVLVSYEVTIAAHDGVPGCSVPVAWFAPPPGARDLVAGTEVVVVGEVRRRFFRAGGATQSRTEVIATKVLRASRAKAVERLVLDALVTCEEAFTGAAA